MTRKGKTNVNASKNGASVPPAQSPLRWCNVRLDDEDGMLIDERGASLEQLASQLIGTALENGFDVSIKVVTDGNWMAAFVGTDPFVDGGKVGVSSFSPDVLGCINGLLYKWFDKMGEQFSPPGGTSQGRYR